jgi:hypothetical protein
MQSIMFDIAQKSAGEVCFVDVRYDGTGLVEYKTHDGAQRALQTLNGFVEGISLFCILFAMLNECNIVSFWFRTEIRVSGQQYSSLIIGVSDFSAASSGSPSNNGNSRSSPQQRSTRHLLNPGSETEDDIR